MRRTFGRLLKVRLIRVFIVISLLMGAGSLFILCGSVAWGAQLQDRTLRLSNNIPGQQSNYELHLTIPSPETLGSVEVNFCSNSAILSDPCTPPVGFDVTGATLASQTGETGFSIDASSSANRLVLTRTPSATPGGVVVFTLAGVQNSSNNGSAYARLHTYASSDATGPPNDYGALAFSLNDAFGLSAEVPPYLLMCLGVKIASVDCSDVQGDVAELGTFSTAHASTGSTQVVVATNAQNGYSLRINGSTMASGNNTILALSTPTASAPGTSQFGINLRANSDPSAGNDPTGPGSGTVAAGYNQVNRFKFNAGDILASGSGAEDYRKYSVTYLVNISKAQPPGVYASTFSYIALGNF